MLAALSIRDIVLIERLEIDFARGLTVLTGETGAGKSILLDSLSLALGGRGDAGLVRHGAAQGQVTAVFDVAGDHPARRLLAENDIEASGDLIVRRVQSADGRTRAFLNDSPVSATLLRSVGERLVEIHGQHDDRALIDEREHRRLLDAFGGLEGPVAALGAAWSAWRKAIRERDGHRARIEAARREADYLRASLEELDALKPEAGEETELATRRHKMMQSEKVAGDLSEAVETFEGTHSPIPVIVTLMRTLERKAGALPGLAESALKPMGEALDLLEAARGALEAALREADFDPRELERTEERLFALRAAARKHSCAVDALAPLRVRMATDLADLDHGEERLAALEAAVEAAEADYRVQARALSAARETAARALEIAVAAELPALKLERARFLIDRSEDAPGTEGIDRIEFHVQTNPGTRAGPMMKVASGGELSRFLLALKVSLADKGSAPTLIFDEIDTGVGGAVAGAIGQRLARLAETVQVMSVTHAPQVAARADTHFLISKEPVAGGEDRVVTRVVELDADARRDEIARMLSGETITAEARAAAESLLAG
ncbi:DNA repair protein RecN [Pinisolibacter aquiterrae]|uniref:DNA repair protein RecN n=1 Tax=Pinisolibacter aquiterrae TaxID=2815579 RepID=UPI001C3C9CAE|nr:DNA repair protein RecN [Pinisolibacter aquiterrae]MBV5263261.1 DNA repair protein RecN [Pinisolibacter aquiterrae]MCC8237661.1 DNA repair protein RecN [Pinisolibacter aquiterrae]